MIKKGHTEVVAEIERILLPQKLFFNTLLFGQKVKTFFTDLTDTEQKDIFRKVLTLDDYLLYYDESSKKLKTQNEDLEKIKSQIDININLINQLKNQLEQLEESKVNFYKAKKIEIEILTKDYSKISFDLKEKNKELLSFGNSDLDTIHTRLNDHCSDLRNKIQNEKNNISNIFEQLLSKKNEKENTFKSEISLQKANINSNKDSEVTEEKISFENESKDLQIELTTLNNNINNVRIEYQKQVKDYTKLTEDIKNLKEDLSSGSIICPTCKQKVGKDNLIHFENELKIKQESIESLKTTLESLKKTGNELKNKISEKEETLKTLKDSCLLNIRNIEKKYDNIIKELETKLNSNLKIILEKYKEVVSSTGEKNTKNIEELSKELSKTETEKNEIFNRIKEKNTILERINNFEHQLINFKGLIDLKEKQHFDNSVIDRNNSKLIELKEKESLLNKEQKETEELSNIYTVWKTGFSSSGIPSMLIDEAIPFMNEQIRYYLDQIGGRYLVSFDTLRKNKDEEFKDKIAINILDTVTKANSRKQLSGGQTRIVDIATILTLRDLQSREQDMKTNIIILDEIFDSLDSKNIEYVSTVLRKLIKGNSINIISHTQIDQLDTDEVLRFY
jgi:DNA repair exonuclease SbcCD ATPase subunit